MLLAAATSSQLLNLPVLQLPCPVSCTCCEGPTGPTSGTRRILFVATCCRGPVSANHAHACARCGMPDPTSKQNTKPTPPETKRSVRSDGRFRVDSQSPDIGPRDATTAQTRDPFAPHLGVEAWRQKAPHHEHPQQVSVRPLQPLTRTLISLQPVLLQSCRFVGGAPADFIFAPFARAQVAWRGGVAWRRGVAAWRRVPSP